MGIKGLTARLVSYTSPWPPKDQPVNLSATRSVIIDGPSLAYFIYYRCLKEQESSSNALDVYPSYEQVTNAVLRFLGRLEASEFKIHSIYFDGRLPINKRDVRLQRLQSNLNQLRAFRSAHPFLGAPDKVSQNGGRPHFANAPGIIASAVAASRSTPLPALSFLVSAVIEELLASRYSNVISIVPDEADIYCAESAHENPGSVVLSSDSDLLVHCSEGCVVFFSDIEASDTGVRINRCYQPGSIARTLGCADFRVLAYVMARDPYVSASQAARTVEERGSTLKEEGSCWYEKVLLEPQHLRGQLDEIHMSRMDRRLNLAIRDPRISELFCDWTLKTKAPQRTAVSSNDKPEVRMYLPFLIDDPSRASAWRLSLSVRRLAYSLLNKLGRPFTMLEVDRRGIEIQEHRVSLMDHPFDYKTSAMRCRILPDMQGMVWLMHLIEGFWELAQDEVSQTPFSLETLLGLVSKDGAVTSWDVVHLKAQLEGYIYSLRLLYFVLRLCSEDAGAYALIQKNSLFTTYINLGNMQERIKVGVSPNDPYPIDKAAFRKQAYAWYGTTEEEEQRKAGAKVTRSKKEAKQKLKRTEQQGKLIRRRDSSNIYSQLSKS